MPTWRQASPSRACETPRMAKLLAGAHVPTCPLRLVLHLGRTPATNPVLPVPQPQATSPPSAPPTTTTTTTTTAMPMTTNRVFALAASGSGRMARGVAAAVAAWPLRTAPPLQRTQLQPRLSQLLRPVPTPSLWAQRRALALAPARQQPAPGSQRGWLPQPLPPLRPAARARGWPTTTARLPSCQMHAVAL